jgi:hypothetical protein
MCKVYKQVTIVKQDLEPIQASWTKYGCSILIDGWNDMKEQNIINILVPIFLSSIDTFVKLFGTLIIINYIHGHIIQAIMDV